MNHERQKKEKRKTTRLMRVHTHTHISCSVLNVIQCTCQKHPMMYTNANIKHNFSDGCDTWGWNDKAGRYFNIVILFHGSCMRRKLHVETKANICNTSHSPETHRTHIHHCSSASLKKKKMWNKTKSILSFAVSSLRSEMEAILFYCHKDRGISRIAGGGVSTHFHTGGTEEHVCVCGVQWGDAGGLQWEGIAPFGP